MSGGESMSETIICVGGVVLESIFNVDTIPGRGVKLMPRSAMQLASGMAPSAAASIVRLGGQASLWGACGNDANGRTVRQQLSAEGIAVEALVEVQGGVTAFSSILVDTRGERLVVPYFDPTLRGAIHHLPAAEVGRAAAVLADVRWVEGAELALRLARESSVPTVLDADVAAPEVLWQLLPLADHVLFSEPALQSLADGAPAHQALQFIVARLPKAQVIGVTLGSDGALIWARQGDPVLAHYPGHAVRVVDTLNAGDVWHGAYALGLVRAMPLAQRVQFANAAAAIKCERPWGRLGAPTLREVCARLESTPPMALDALRLFQQGLPPRLPNDGPHLL